MAHLERQLLPIVILNRRVHLKLKNLMGSQVLVGIHTVYDFLRIKPVMFEEIFSSVIISVPW